MRFAILFLLAVAIDDDKSRCKQISPCACSFDDGTQIDLSNLFSPVPNNGSVYLYDAANITTVYYHGFQDVRFDVNIMNITADHCRSPATICGHDEQTQAFFTLATSSTGKFSIDDRNVYTMSYNFANYTTIVQLACTPGFDDNNIKLQAVSGDHRQYKLVLYSKYACRISSPDGKL